ncbi:MAG: hypothetical protein IPJ65_17910 [Archangiaceae bacterium]|nr:hypothetical protein [Archangiaceae bacterium]
MLLTALTLALLAAAPEGAAAPAPAYTFNLAELIWKGDLPLDAEAHAPRLYAFIAKADPTHPMFARAQLYLAQSLARLGYSQAAAVWFARVATERTDPEALPAALDGLLAVFQGRTTRRSRRWCSAPSTWRRCR